MKPVTFPEANVTWAKNQPQYGQLPTAAACDEEGTVVSCWKLSWRERFAALFGRPVWLSVLTFHHRLQPQLLSLKKPTIVHHKHDDEIIVTRIEMR